MRIVVALLLALLTAGCMHRAPMPPNAEMSGFLDDYSLLREGGPNELKLVYRNPEAKWSAYHEVLLEPITLWRSGRKSLAPVPEEDLLRLVSDFQNAVRMRLGEGFRFVDAPGPGVMRIRLGITDARASDHVLDVLTAPHGTGRPHPAGAGALDPETKRFLARAVIEGEIRDAQTNTLLAEGIDWRPRDLPPVETWAEIDRGLAFWADRTCTRLEARVGGR
jgi:hypothetical protein